MKFQELVIMLPCHSLEDFPLHHEGQEADGLLAAWTALWHPVFMATSERMPTWARADDPPEELHDRLMVIPEVSESLLLAGWPARAKQEGACVIRKKTSRSEIIAAGLVRSIARRKSPTKSWESFSRWDSPTCRRNCSPAKCVI